MPYIYGDFPVYPSSLHPRLTLEEKMAMGLGALSRRVTLSWTGMSVQEGIL